MFTNRISYPLKFKAAILEQNHCPLIIDEVTFSGPLEPGQVLVKMLTSGICGKQLEEIEATRGKDPYLPHMLGHEGCGTVVDIGPGVQKVVPGNLVVLHWVKGSGTDAAPPLYSRNGQRINAGWITTFNEYAVISENRMTIIPDNSDAEIACLLGCAVTTGIGVILNEASVRPGESVCVFGCGGVGLSAIQGARLVNAYPIIAIDKEDNNLKLAAEMGATHLINSNKTEVLASVSQITSGKLCDYVIITVTKSHALELAVECAAIPGEVMFVGVPAAGDTVSINPFAIHCRRVLRGSFGGGIVPDRDIPRYYDLQARGALQLNKLIGEKVSLSDINKGIAILKNGLAGRCIVDFR